MTDRVARDVYVHHLTYALGEERRSVEESYAQGAITTDPQVFHDAGFRQHHRSAPASTAYDLAKHALLRIEGGLGKIDALVYVTCIPANGSIGDAASFCTSRDVKCLMDFPASHLQADFGLDNALVLGLNQQACTGLLGSLRVARMCLLSEPEIERVLCLTADRFPEGALYEQSYNLISDGAAGCIVSTEPLGFRLIACHGITNGALARASDDETAGTYFNYTLRVIRETLAKAALTIDDIQWIVPQNMNVKAWQILARLLGIEPERVFFGSIGEAAHVISGDNIINLQSLSESGRIQRGDKLLLSMAGYGLNWQATILEAR